MTSHQIKLSSTLTRQLTDVRYRPDVPRGPKTRTDEEVKLMYQIQKKIGQGLFSKVYLAKDATGLRVALKVIPKKDFQEEALIKKILTEKELLIRLNHPNILRLHRTIQSNLYLYIVLEYCDKGTLADLERSDVRLGVEALRVIAAQIIEALAYLHAKGVVYGDLKAENVLINQQGVIKLADFNLSATSSLLDNRIQGTISYIAPELLLQNKRSEKTDWWALGVLLHLLFYRRFPFKMDNQAEMMVSLYSKSVIEEAPDLRAPADFRRLILGLLEKDPKRRLGDNLQQIKRHAFFRDFDWKRFQFDQANFEYAQHLPSLGADNPHSRSIGPEAGDRFDGGARYYYNIDNFTYEGDPDFKSAKSFLVASKDGK